MCCCCFGFYLRCIKSNIIRGLDMVRMLLCRWIFVSMYWCNMLMHMRVVLVAFDIMFHTIRCVALKFARVKFCHFTCLTLCIKFHYITILFLRVMFHSHFELLVMIVLHISNPFLIRVDTRCFNVIMFNRSYERICGHTKEFVFLRKNWQPYKRIHELALSIYTGPYQVHD